MKSFKPNVLRSLPLWALVLCGLTSCGTRESRVAQGNRDQVLHLSNGTEPEDIDPHIVTGVPEHNIITSLIEGLVSEDPKTLKPIPGSAESWDVSEDGTVYTFHLRDNAVWTNGRKVVADDFLQSFKRILTPSLGAKYAYMLFVMKNAEAYQSGAITDFNEVGVKALDEKTLEITLEHSTPYFLSLLNHYTWFPVPVDIIEKHGRPDQRGNRWTRPENFVGNGPFKLAEWRMNDVLAVEKNPTYWDANQVKLKRIHFYPIDSEDTDERGFRAGQTHNVYQLPQSKIDTYKKENPDLLRIEPYAGTYFYRINVTKPPLNDVRVRKALSIAIDREAIVESVTRGGQIPGYFYTPPDMAGYNARARVSSDKELAVKLLAEAGYPNGEGFPSVEILYNTNEGHRNIAEAIQEMWRQTLNIQATLVNQEWKVYLDAQRNLNYAVSRAGWIGDYVDPNSFLDMWTSYSQQNQTGWSHPEYDRLIAEAGAESDPSERLEIFQKAEALLLEEMPIIPIYIYTRVYALQPSVKGWHPNILDHHPYKHIYLEDPGQ